MTLAEIFTFLQRIGQLRQWVFFSFIFVGTLATAKLLLYWPETAPVRVPGSVITFELTCIPAAMEFRLQGAYSGPIIASAAVTEAGVVNDDPPTDFEAQGPIFDGDSTTLILVARDRRAGAVLLPELQRSILNVHVGRATSVDVLSILDKTPENPRCSPALLEGKRLDAAIVTAGARIHYFRLIQEVIGDLTLQVNEIIGNVLLASMCIAMFWIVGYVIAGVTISYFVPDKSVRQMISSRRKEVRAIGIDDDMVAVIETDFLDIERRMSFARAVGPALGFLLTVSALIAALHPSVQVEQDAFRFVTSLQLAMTATMIGLLIRIAAEFSIRLHRGIALRKIAILTESSK